jgi:hypothetical protein
VVRVANVKIIKMRPIYVNDTPVSKDISNIKVERIRAKLKSCAGPFSLEWLTKPEY